MFVSLVLKVGDIVISLLELLIQAMQFDQTAADVANEPYWIHPALSEVVENALLNVRRPST